VVFLPGLLRHYRSTMMSLCCAHKNTKFLLYLLSKSYAPRKRERLNHDRNCHYL
jgi:hypothetical protein